MKLSPQKEYLVGFLRDFKEHCASEWASRVKDDRTRFCELEPYMAQRGYVITSVPCKGSVCGRKECPLNKRQAVKVARPAHGEFDHAPETCPMCIQNKINVLNF